MSAAVPYAFGEAIEEVRLGKGDLVLLIGPAGGQTAHFLLMRI